MKRNIIIIQGLLLSLLTLSACSSIPTPPIEEQQILSDGNVVIKDVYSELTEEDFSTLSRILEKQMMFHKRHFVFIQPPVIETRIFKSEQQYKHYQSNISGSSASTNGFYSGRKKVIAINKNKHYLRTIIHEAQHAILRSKFSNVPNWINEGLSEFYERAYISNNRILVRNQPSRVKQLQRWSLDGSLMKLSTLVNLNRKSWKKQDKRTRTISWGLIYFLKSKPEGDVMISTIIRELLDNKSKTSSSVLDEIYEGGIIGLERDFHLFIQNVPDKQEI